MAGAAGPGPGLYPVGCLACLPADMKELTGRGVSGSPVPPSGPHPVPTPHQTHLCPALQINDQPHCGLLDLLCMGGHRHRASGSKCSTGHHPPSRGCGFLFVSVGVPASLVRPQARSAHKSLKSHGPLCRNKVTKAHRLAGSPGWGFLPIQTPLTISWPCHPHAAPGKSPGSGQSCMEPPGVGLEPPPMPKVLPGELGAAR